MAGSHMYITDQDEGMNAVVDKRQRTYMYVTALIGFVLALALVIFPEASFAASLEGLKLWLEVVLPALLPFFIMSELLMGLGVVHFIGALLEPIMQPLFRIPGVGGFAVAIGLASGYPIGAKITADLRRDNLCTQVEAERLVSFSNTADPLFIAGAVAVGMLGMPQVAFTLLAAHYLGAIVVGLSMRLYARDQVTHHTNTSQEPLLTKAVNELINARKRDGRHLGVLFHDAVSNTFMSLLFVGGCIMMFSVISRLFTLSGITTFFAGITAQLLSFTNISRELIEGLFAGIFEIDIGAQAVSQASVPIIQKLVAISAIISWSGLSVHAQVAAMIHGTDIRLKPYIMARTIHAVASGIMAWLLYRPSQAVWQKISLAVPVFAESLFIQPTFSTILTTSVKTVLVITAFLCVLGVILYFFNRVVIFWVRQK